MATLSWDFEDGTLQGWVADDSDFQVYSDPARGSYSAGLKGNADLDVAHVSPSELDGGKQVNFVEFWYQEGSGSRGGGISVVDSSGNEVIGFATSNPDWCIKDGNGWEELSDNGGTYDTWIKVKITFDWSAGTAEIEANQDGGSVYTYADRPLINNTNVESFYFKGFANTGGGWESDTAQDMWLDDITIDVDFNPVVSTDPAASVDSESATLNGTLDELGSESSADVYFEWGTDDSYGNTTNAQTLSSTGSFSDSISGLNVLTEYHFRAAVTDGLDTWYGDDVVFITGDFIYEERTESDFAGGVLTDVEADSADKLVLKGDQAVYDFEDGAFGSDWERTTNFNIYSSPARGDYSAGQDSGNNVDALLAPSKLSGGVQIAKFSFYYQETSSQSGGGLGLIDSNGDEILGLGSNNHQWAIYDADGYWEPYSGDGYERWVYMEAAFDWGNGSYDYYIEDTASGHVEQGTGTLIHNTDVEKILFGENCNLASNTGPANYMWFDDIVLDSGYKSSGDRITPEIDISTLSGIDDSLVEWDSIEPTDTSITVESRYSTDAGATWSAYETCTSGSAVPSLPSDADLVQFKQTLQTDDVSVTPELKFFGVYLAEETGDIVEAPPAVFYYQAKSSIKFDAVILVPPAKFYYQSKGKAVLNEIVSAPPAVYNYRALVSVAFSVEVIAPPAKFYHQGIIEYVDSYKPPVFLTDFVSMTNARRDKAISYDKQHAFDMGPVERGNIDEGLLARAWRLRVDGTDVYLAIANEQNTKWQSEFKEFELPHSPVYSMDLTFDQNGMPFACWEYEGEVWIYWYDPTISEMDIKYVCDGRTPRAKLDARARHQLPDSDIYIFYINDNNDEIEYRVQRDRYDTAYIAPLLVQDEETDIEGSVVSEAVYKSTENLYLETLAMSRGWRFYVWISEYHPENEGTYRPAYSLTWLHSAIYPYYLVEELGAFPDNIVRGGKEEDFSDFDDEKVTADIDMLSASLRDAMLSGDFDDEELLVDIVMSSAGLREAILSNDFADEEVTQDSPEVTAASLRQAIILASIYYDEELQQGVPVISGATREEV